MYHSEEYRQLVRKLETDKNAKTNVNTSGTRFDCMQMLYHRRHKNFTALLKRTAAECIRHEREHCKSSMAQYHLNQARSLYAELIGSQACNGVVGVDHELSEVKNDQTNQSHTFVEFSSAVSYYNDLFMQWNQALRYMPINWHDWPVMVQIAELYVVRASLSYTLQQYDKAFSDLRHASSVFRYFASPLDMLEYLRAELVYELQQQQRQQQHCQQEMKDEEENAEDAELDDTSDEGEDMILKSKNVSLIPTSVATNNTNVSILPTMVALKLLLMEQTVFRGKATSNLESDDWSSILDQLLKSFGCSREMIQIDSQNLEVIKFNLILFNFAMYQNINNDNQDIATKSIDSLPLLKFMYQLDDTIEQWWYRTSGNRQQKWCSLYNNEGSTLLSNYKLSNKVHLHQQVNDGRCYAAKSNILEGELILRERPLSLVIFTEYLFQYCTYCYRSMVTFWPCGQCTEVAYCSAQCSMLAYAEFHYAECGIYGLILGKENFYSMAHLYRLYASFGIHTVIECEENEEIALSSTTTSSSDASSKMKYTSILLSTFMNNSPGGGGGGENDQRASVKLSSPSGFNLEHDFLSSSTLQHLPLRKLSPPDRVRLYRAITTLLSHRGARDSPREHSHTILAYSMIAMFVHKGLLDESVYDCEPVCARLAEHIATGMLRTCTNGFCWAEERLKRENYGTEEISLTATSSQKEIVKIASCLCLVASFFNHDCDPNVNWYITETGIQLHAARPIAPNEPLTICYGPKKHNEFLVRQQRLRDDYCFFCHCNVCLKDAALAPLNGNWSLPCMAANGANCPGPLVLNRYRSCLACGQQESLSTHQTLPKTLKMIERSSKKFKKLIDKLTQGYVKWQKKLTKKHERQQRRLKQLQVAKHIWQYISCMRFGGGGGGGGGQGSNDGGNDTNQNQHKKPLFTNLNQPTQLIGSTKNTICSTAAISWHRKLLHGLTKSISSSLPFISSASKLSSSKLECKLLTLEHHFNTYYQLIFKGSYQLLEYTTLLLYVYNQFGIPFRGVPLIYIVEHILPYIFPSLIEGELIKLIYMLDYVADFFDNLNTLIPLENGVDVEIANNDNEVNDTDDDDDERGDSDNYNDQKTLLKKLKSLMTHKLMQKSSNTTTSITTAIVNYYRVIQKINEKLLDILRYDLLYRGELFPKLHQQMIQVKNVKEPMVVIPDNDDAIVDANEELEQQKEKKENAKNTYNSTNLTSSSLSLKLSSSSLSSSYLSLQSQSTSMNEKYFKHLYHSCQRRLTMVERKINLITGGGGGNTATE